MIFERRRARRDRARTARPAGRRAAGRGTRLLLVGVLLAATAGCSFGSSDPEPSPLATGINAPAGRVDPATDSRFAAYYGQQVAWNDCRDGLQCASVTVPLDWADPAGSTIRLAVAKKPAEGRRIGSLLFNPGGPGVPGIRYVRAANRLFGPRLLSAYDIVGWDTRGVGASTPAITCLPNSQLDAYFSSDATPDDAAELATAVDYTKQMAAACEANTGPLLEHVDTLSTVKDMDVLRSVLGDAVLAYQGDSYGTFLGAWYAQEFPWRVGRFVLDGAVDPTLTAAQYADGQARGFERGLDAYLSDCRGRSGCPLRGSREDQYATLSRLVARSDATPLRTSTPQRPLTQALMVTGIARALYDSVFWPNLDQGLKSALQGDGTGLLRLADDYLERDPKGTYGQSLQATGPIFCLDHPESRTPAEIAADAASVGRSYPPLGDSIAWGALSCSGWPIKAVLTPQRLTAQGAAPIMVVGTRGDPATPYEWAVSLAGQLSGARLVTWEGQGHTAYGRGSTCVDHAVENYLVSGIVPASNVTCS